MIMPFRENTVPIPTNPLVSMQPTKAIARACNFTAVIFSLNSGADIKTTKIGAVAISIAAKDKEFSITDMPKNKFSAIELATPAQMKHQRSIIFIFRRSLSKMQRATKVMIKEITILTNTIVRGLYPSASKNLTKTPTEPQLHPAIMTQIGAIIFAFVSISMIISDFNKIVVVIDSFVMISFKYIVHIVSEIQGGKVKKGYRTNYEKQIDTALLAFTNWDHQKIVDKLGLKQDDDFIYIDELGITYRLHKRDAEIEKTIDGVTYTDDVNFDESASIFDLFGYSKDNLFLSGKWANIWNVEKNIHVGHASNSHFFKKYETFFTGQIERLNKACEGLGGIKAEYADTSYIFNAFDFLPIMFQFWDADDEFPARVRMLWDENILDYIRFETTFSLQLHLLNRICETMG